MFGSPWAFRPLALWVQVPPRGAPAQRLVPHAELERLQLLPGADERALRAEVERLRGELTLHRQLVEHTARARRRAEHELRDVQQQHGAAVARLTHVRSELEGARGALQDLDDQLAGAGVIRRADRPSAARVRARHLDAVTTT